MNGMKRYAAPLLVALLLAIIWLRPLDDLAKRNVDSGMQRAAVTFAAARGLNALLSLAQSASVEGNAIFVSGSINPGALLEPIDDLIEQFSTLMLWATVSFGVQAVLLTASSSWGATILLSLAAVYWAMLRWRGKAVPSRLVLTAILLAVLRLAVPLLAVLSEGTYQWLLREKYEQTQAEVEKVAEEQDGLLDRLQEKLSISEVKRLMTRVAGTVDYVIKLATVFVVQVIVLPLAFLWLVVLLVRKSTRSAGTGGLPAAPTLPTESL